MNFHDQKSWLIMIKISSHDHDWLWSSSPLVILSWCLIMKNHQSWSWIIKDDDPLIKGGHFTIMFWSWFFDDFSWPIMVRNNPDYHQPIQPGNNYMIFFFKHDLNGRNTTSLPTRMKQMVLSGIAGTPRMHQETLPLTLSADWSVPWVGSADWLQGH